MSKALEVTVVRSNWYRGRGSVDSKLLIGDGRVDEGKMCCLGFACLAAGLTKDDIEDKACPSNILNYRARTGIGPLDLPKPLMALAYDEYGDEIEFVDSNHCDLMTEANDSRDSLKIKSEADREEKLTALGREIGINFTFVD